MSSSCFSGDCGFCSGCSGDVGPKVVGYLPPKEFYKMNTGEVPPLAPEPKDPRVLWQKMMYGSDLYRIHVDGTWGRLVRRKAFRERLIKKSSRMYAPDGIFWEIYRSHIEFVKGCTEEGVIYGKNRCLRPENRMLYSMINKGEVDINYLGGKVVCRGGGLFDLDALKKQMNLKNKDYEEYFGKFQNYLIEVNKTMNGYGVSLGKSFRGKVPEFIKIGDEKYTIWDDNRVMCDDPECSLMTHCMINWDIKDNYTGNHPPAYSSYYYGPIIGSIPKYTKNKEHELCLTCALKASNTAGVFSPEEFETTLLSRN